MDDRQEETMVPIARNRCPHCDPFSIRLEEISRQLDKLELKVERELNKLLLRQLAIIRIQ